MSKILFLFVIFTTIILQLSVTGSLLGTLTSKLKCALHDLTDTKSHYSKKSPNLYHNRSVEEITKAWQSTFIDTSSYLPGKIKNNIPFSQLQLRDPYTILSMAEYQALIYCRTHRNDDLSVITQMETKNLRIGLFKILSTGVDRKHSLFWYLGINQQQKLLVLIHRGTTRQNPDDVLDDFDTIKISAKKASLKLDFPYLNVDEMHHLYVAQGFHSRFKNQQVSILYAVQIALEMYKEYSFVVVGHSLGAAWAFLNAGYFAGIPEISNRLTAVYTFGQPLLGNAEFVDQLANKIGVNKIVRVVNKNDLIPHVGCESCVQPQIPNEKWISIGPDSKWVDCNGGHDMNCSAGLLCKDLSWAEHSSVGNFSMRSEFCRIKSNL